MAAWKIKVFMEDSADQSWEFFEKKLDIVGYSLIEKDQDLHI